MKVERRKLDPVGHAVWILVGVSGILLGGFAAPAVAIFWWLCYWQRNAT